GVRITIVDDATGAPAQVYAFDGITPYPSTIVSGRAVTDSAGVIHSLGPGEYRFPLLAFGRYRLAIAPPSPFTAPSIASPEELALLARPDGQPFEVSDGSYGQPFDVISVVPLRIDVPLDSAGGVLSLRKRVSRDEAQPGDALLYHLSVRNQSSTVPTDTVLVSDRFPASLRLAKESVRVDGLEAAETVTP